MANRTRQILFPLVEESSNENCTTVRVFLMEGKQFIKDLKKDSMCYALIPRKPDKRTKNEQPLERKELLIEFQDIILDNVPNGLPPIRSISHYVDLISGAIFSNKAPHRLTSAINVELNRQFQELLQKCLIR